MHLAVVVKVIYPKYSEHLAYALAHENVQASLPETSHFLQFLFSVYSTWDI